MEILKSLFSDSLILDGLCPLLETLDCIVKDATLLEEEIEAVLVVMCEEIPELEPFTLFHYY